MLKKSLWASVLLLVAIAALMGSGTIDLGPITGTAVSPSVTLPTSNPSETPTALVSARALLDTLPVKGRAPKTGYDRVEKFGEAWLDVDANGCSTREDILRRDLIDTTTDNSCVVRSGVLNDPYTGQTIPFLRGSTTSNRVQIDHVVSLSNAWQTGAQRLDLATRIRFANDPLNLLAVDGPTNMQKSNGDAATWLPPNRAYWCPLVARQVSVKAAYGLWVTPPEHDAIARVLESCPSEPAP